MRQPPPEKTRDGRINPKGLPCFYAAFEPHTAIAEVRPWRNATISVARFKVRRDIGVVDLRWQSGLTSSPAVYWAAHMVQRPVHEEDPFAYVGTQYLAERLKAAGAGGLLYDSALGPYDKARESRGTNVALFSVAFDEVDGADVAFWRVRAVTYDADARPS